MSPQPVASTTRRGGTASISSGAPPANTTEPRVPRVISTSLTPAARTLLGRPADGPIAGVDENLLLVGLEHVDVAQMAGAAPWLAGAHLARHDPAGQALHIHRDRAARPCATGDDRRIDVLVGQRPDLPDPRLDPRHVGQGQRVGSGIDPLNPDVGVLQGIDVAERGGCPGRPVEHGHARGEKLLQQRRLVVDGDLGQDGGPQAEPRIHHGGVVGGPARPRLVLRPAMVLMSRTT